MKRLFVYLYPVILIWMSICYFLLLLLGILSFSLLIFYCSCFPLLFSFKGSFCSFWIQFVFSSLLYYHLLSINLLRRVYKDSIEICFFFSIASFQDIKCCTLMVMYFMFVALYNLLFLSSFCSNRSSVFTLLFFVYLFNLVWPLLFTSWRTNYSLHVFFFQWTSFSLSLLLFGITKQKNGGWWEMGSGIDQVSDAGGGTENGSAHDRVWKESQIFLYWQSWRAL